MKFSTPNAIIRILLTLLLLSWGLIFVVLRKTEAREKWMKDRIEYVEDECRRILVAKSNINDLPEEQIRICQKAIPLLIRDKPTLLEQFKMLIDVEENDTYWTIELIPIGTNRDREYIQVDKQTEEIHYSTGTQ